MVLNASNQVTGQTHINTVDGIWVGPPTFILPTSIESINTVPSINITPPLPNPLPEEPLGPGDAPPIKDHTWAPGLGAGGPGTVNEKGQ